MSYQQGPTADPHSLTRRTAFPLRRFGMFVAFLVLANATPVLAQTPAQPAIPELAAPFASADDREVVSDEAEWIWNGFYAGKAAEAGFYQLAESFYRAGLSSSGTNPAIRDEMRLGLVTALIAQSKPKQAMEVLEAFEGERGQEWSLRQTAVDFLEGRYVEVAAALREIEHETLPRADVAWFFFLRAMSRYESGNEGRAENSMESAIENSTSSAERAFFRVGQVQGELIAGDASEELAAGILEEIERTRGRPVESIFTLQYATVLDALGRKAEAIDVLRSQLTRLPEGGSEVRDKTLLLLGLMSGVTTQVGRDAFEELLLTGTNASFQRTALLELAAPQSGTSDDVQARIKTTVEGLLAQVPAHPLSDLLLLVQADLALRGKAFPEAEAAANELLSRFPGSELRTNALALLADSAWQRPRYRIAADAVSRIRAGYEGVEGSEEVRARLAVLLGECYYRAGLNRGTEEDFRNAAEAYAVAESENPPGVKGGALFFQRVISLMRGGQVDEAIRVLDEAEGRGISAESRWQAEWNLARFLQLNRRGQEAFRRVESLGEAVGGSPEIRLRFLWLAAKLSLNVEQPLGTIDRVTRVLDFLDSEEGRGISSDLRAEVASNGSLLAARALLETDNPQAGIEAMERLRVDFPGSRAAIYSFIVQARHLAANNRLVEAQQLLIDLADNHPESEFAPQALYEAALQAIRRGQDAYLEEANDLLQRLRDDYPDEPLLFRALLEQGDIFRRLNQFSVAERIYELAENSFPNHPERIVAQLSLADTLRAQASSDPLKFEAAISRLEKLTDLPSAPVDLRAEAGFKLGSAWQTQGRPDRASQVYWQVYTRILSDPAIADRLGAKGRFWVGKSLLELGRIEEQAGRADEARRWYEAVLQYHLPGEKVALGRLGRYQAVQ